MRPVILAAAILILQGSASAHEPERYRLEKTPDGYVRMDTKTGEMSACEKAGSGLVCRMAADERSAMQDEIERLQSDLDALGKRVLQLENSLAAKNEQSLPTEEDFDRTMSYMERFFRSFMGVVKEFEEEKPVPGEPGTNRT